MGCNKSKPVESPIDEKAQPESVLPPPPIKIDTTYVKNDEKIKTPAVTPQVTPKNPNLPPPVKRSPDKASPLSKTINVTQPYKVPNNNKVKQLNIRTEGLTLSESEMKSSPERNSAISGIECKPAGRPSLYKTPRIPKTPAFHKKDRLSASMITFDFPETPNNSTFSAGLAAKRPSLADIGQNFMKRQMIKLN